MAKKNKQTQVVNSGVVSDFDGTVWSYIGVGVLEFLVMALMLGIGEAAMLVRGPESIIAIIVLVVCVVIGAAGMTIIFMKWDAKHTIISGQRLKFKASAFSLLGNYLKWVLLTVITLGIYSLWLPIKVRKWKAQHTTSSPVESDFGYNSNVQYYNF